MGREPAEIHRVWQRVWHQLGSGAGASTVSFVYGPDGARLKKIKATLYLGADLEIAPDGTWTKDATGGSKRVLLWAIARDDRPWGSDPPAVAYSYPPGRGGTHAVKFLTGSKINDAPAC